MMFSGEASSIFKCVGIEGTPFSVTFPPLGWPHISSVSIEKADVLGATINKLTTLDREYLASTFQSLWLHKTFYTQPQHFILCDKKALVFLILPSIFAFRKICWGYLIMTTPFGRSNRFICILPEAIDRKIVLVRLCLFADILQTDIVALVLYVLLFVATCVGACEYYAYAL